jgi:hypothetical protein
VRGAGSRGSYQRRPPRQVEVGLNAPNIGRTKLVETGERRDETASAKLQVVPLPSPSTTHSSTLRVSTPGTTNRTTPAHSVDQPPPQMAQTPLAMNGPSSNAHSKSSADLFKLYAVDPVHGLTTAQVLENRRLFGENGTRTQRSDTSRGFIR